jgi:hypothetical protein
MDKLPLLVFKMGEVAHCFLLRLGDSLGCALFVAALDNFGDTLKKNEIKTTVTRISASPCQPCGSNIPKTQLSADTTRTGRTLHLQVALDITEERDVTYTRNREQEKGASKDEDSEEGRNCEGGGDQTVSSEVLLDVVERRLVILFRQVDGKQSQGINDLTRTFSEK